MLERDAKMLPLVMLSSCLGGVDLPDDVRETCSTEIQALEESCDRWDGSFNKTVDEARGCLGDRVKILCQNPGPFEPKILTIKRPPK